MYFVPNTLHLLPPSWIHFYILSTYISALFISHLEVLRVDNAYYIFIYVKYITHIIYLYIMYINILCKYFNVNIYMHS